MKKWIYFLILAISIFFIFSLQNLYANSNPVCPNHINIKMPMSEKSRTVTCTKTGVIVYYCRVCKILGRTSEKTVLVSAYGHSWNSNHVCTRCQKNMGGHWFKVNGSSYCCVACNLTLQISNMSPDLPGITGYRVSPYDNPPSAGSVTVTFNALDKSIKAIHPGK